MNISALNITDYLLSKKWENEFESLNTFSTDFGETYNFDIKNIRNTLLKLSIKDQNFFIKQPKFFISGTSWPIINEANFFELNKHLDFNNISFFYDDINRVLVMDCLRRNKNLRSSYKDCVEEAVIHLSKMHEIYSLNGENRQKIKEFVLYNGLNNLNHYQTFLNQISFGIHSDLFLDEVVFLKIYKEKSPEFRPLLYNLIRSKEVLVAFNELKSLDKTNCLIHGDIKYNNIGFKGEGLNFLDFELAGPGDNSWDLACLIEDTLAILYRKENNIKKLEILQSIIKNYSFERDISFIERLFKFWGLKKLERLRYADFTLQEFRGQIYEIEVLLTKNAICASKYQSNNPDFLM